MTNATQVTPTPGKPALLLSAFDLADVGYDVEEFLVAGTACRYTPVNELGPDGRWDITPSGSADFTTRIVVLTPSDPACPSTPCGRLVNVALTLMGTAEWMMPAQTSTARWKAAFASSWPAKPV